MMAVFAILFSVGMLGVALVVNLFLPWENVTSIFLGVGSVFLAFCAGMTFAPSLNDLYYNFRKLTPVKRVASGKAAAAAPAAAPARNAEKNPVYASEMETYTGQRFRY